MSDNYDDIINLSHHVSSTRRQMSVYDRAAQFSPFAALTGYAAAVAETARLTDKYIELDESQKEVLSRRLLIISEQRQEQPQVSLTYFVPDKRKSGGKYVTVIGCVKKIDEYENVVVLMDGTRIAITDIYDIELDI